MKFKASEVRHTSRNEATSDSTVIHEEYMINDTLSTDEVI
jgi:hypothetical protein